MTFLLCLMAVCLIGGAFELATRRYRRIIREARRINRRRWPRHGHTDHFFHDLKRGYFPEDLN